MTERGEVLDGEIKVIPHFEKLEAILETLLEAWDKKEFPYNLDVASLPQNERNMPPELPRGSAEHATFLFTTCYYMRGGIKSTTAFRSLAKLYEQDRALFDPAQAAKTDPAYVTGALQQVGLGFSKEVIGKQWTQNAQRLVERYDGDPRNIFKDVEDYEELLGRVMNDGKGGGFAGFREKMTSMLAYYLMDAELVPYFDFPLPVDLHVLRVSAATEIITFENLPDDGNIYHERTLATLRKMYHDYSTTHGVSQLEVCNAVWSLSSAICGTQPGNIMLEPNRKEGRQGRNTEITPLRIDINDFAQTALYERSCARCPIEKECLYNFPAKNYYVKGKLIGSPRVRFPQQGLFDIRDLK